MDICSLTKLDTQNIDEAAQLLADTFPHSYKATAHEEVHSCLQEGKIALIALIDNHVAGFIGAMPNYGITGWELHPLAVRADMQSKGIGTALVRSLEQQVKAAGGVTLYLGTDDEFYKTSLSDTDLYQDTYEKIMNIKNYRRHPYDFYSKQGYKIVGVLPDVNGLGKPDIFMAKRL